MKFNRILFQAILWIALFGLHSCNQAQNDQGGAQNLEPKAYSEALTKNPGILLDVRTPEEFSAGHLDGATNLNFNGENFAEEVNKLDKTKTVYVYCAVGGRSAKAQALMLENGFKTVINMTGGYNQWASEGLPSSK